MTQKNHSVGQLFNWDWTPQTISGTRGGNAHFSFQKWPKTSKIVFAKLIFILGLKIPYENIEKWADIFHGSSGDYYLWIDHNTSKLWCLFPNFWFLGKFWQENGLGPPRTPLMVWGLQTQPKSKPTGLIFWVQKEKYYDHCGRNITAFPININSSSKRHFCISIGITYRFKMAYLLTF